MGIIPDTDSPGQHTHRYTSVYEVKGAISYIYVVLDTDTYRQINAQIIISAIVEMPYSLSAMICEWKFLRTRWYKLDDLLIMWSQYKGSLEVRL